LLTAVSGAFGSIHETARRIREGSGKKILLIDSLPSFASCWLIPRLSSFYAQNPEVEVEINTVGDLGYPASVARTRNSVAIRVGLSASQWAGLTAEELVHEEMFPVCAPSLLAGPVPLREPRDLAEHTLLIVSRRLEGWPEWLAAAGQYGDATDGVDPNHGRKFDTIQMATTAAIEGMGVVIGRKPLIDLYLKAGLLVEPFRLRIPSKTSYWLVTQPASAGAPLVQAFRCWMRRELGLSVTAPAVTV
jgi:LysR family glycine cleavage system transcriptional activator